MIAQTDRFGVLALRLVKIRAQLQWLYWRPLLYVTLGLCPFGLAFFGSGGIAGAALWALVYLLVIGPSTPAYVLLFADAIRVARGRNAAHYSIEPDTEHLHEREEEIANMPRPAKAFMYLSLWMNPLSVFSTPALLYIRLRERHSHRDKGSSSYTRRTTFAFYLRNLRKTEAELEHVGGKQNNLALV